MVAQMVKKLPVMQETWVQSLGQEDPLEKEMAPHSSILPGEPQGQRSLAGLLFMGSRRVGQDWVTKHKHIYLWNDMFPALYSTSKQAFSK